MAFNLGAFAGAAAQSGMNTYQMLESIESQKKRDALVDLQAQEAKAAAEERTALKGAASSTYGQVGAPETALPGYKMTDAEVANAYAIDQGDPAAVAPKAYTQARADADYLAKVRGISPERALDIEGKQTQTAIGKSSLARIKAEDDFSTWLQESQAQAAKDPVGFLKANLGAYNNAKKGSHLDDGNTASVVTSADGKSFSFVRTDAKGKLVDSTPIDPASAGDALKHIAFSKYASLPGKFKEAEELGMRKTEVALKGKEVGFKEKLLPSEIARNNAAANQANMHANVYGNMLDTAKTNKEAAAAMKPFLDEFAEMTPEDQAGAKGQAILLKGATAGAQKSKDLSGIVSMLRKPDRAAVSAEQEKAAYVAYNEATTPEQIKAVKAKYPDVFGQSAFSKAVAADKQKQQEASANQEVAGRPLYNTAMSDLQRMARRPMGVSTAEANAAQAELEARKGEPRMSALPSK